MGLLPRARIVAEKSARQLNSGGGLAWEDDSGVTSASQPAAAHDTDERNAR